MKKTYTPIGFIGGPCQCEHHDADWHLEPHLGLAARWYKTWRFGRGDEPVIIDEKIAVCFDCLRDILEGEAEAAAEARMS